MNLLDKNISWEQEKVTLGVGHTKPSRKILEQLLKH